LGVPTVEVGDRCGAAALAHVMTALGYRDFAALAGPASSTAAIDRLDGFRAGLAHAGRVLADATVIHATPTRDGGYDGARRLLCPTLARPQLIFATADVIAIGALAAVHDAGLVPGEHVAVAGFGDVPLARDIAPTLTTVRVPLEEVGRRLLAAALDGDKGYIVPAVATEVVVRRSTPGLVPECFGEHLDSQSDRSLA
jgi:LacI family transcriptional regulator